MHNKLVIIGASGHGKVVADIAFNMQRYEKIIFLDDNEEKKECMGFEVVGKSTEATTYIKKADFIVAIGNATIRQKITKQLEKMGANMATIIHPKAIVGKNVTVGEGTVIMANAVINPDSTVGKGCIINTCASVDHDCQINDYVHIAVGAHVCGTVQIGKCTWIGAGAVVKNNVSICEDCMIGVGTAVVKDIEEPDTYVGVPARRMR